MERNTGAEKRSTLIEEFVIPEGRVDIISTSNVSRYRRCRKVILPSTARTIGSRTFFNCPDLEEVVIPPNSVEIIGNAAFADCPKLKRIILPDSVEKIGADCFHNCVSLSEVRLPDVTGHIRVGTFAGCSSLREIRFPERLKAISSLAFANTALRRITLPHHIEIVSGNAFLGVPCEEITISEDFAQKMGDRKNSSPILAGQNKIFCRKLTLTYGPNTRICENPLGNAVRSLIAQDALPYLEEIEAPRHSPFAVFQEDPKYAIPYVRNFVRRKKRRERFSRLDELPFQAYMLWRKEMIWADPEILRYMLDASLLTTDDCERLLNRVLGEKPDIAAMLLDFWRDTEASQPLYEREGFQEMYRETFGNTPTEHSNS